MTEEQIKHERTKMTLDGLASHNRFGLTGGGNPPGAVRSRAEVCPYSVMGLSEEGWCQYGVFDSLQDACAAMKGKVDQYSDKAAVVSTFWYLDQSTKVIETLDTTIYGEKHDNN